MTINMLIYSVHEFGEGRLTTSLTLQRAGATLRVPRMAGRRELGCWLRGLPKGDDRLNLIWVMPAQGQHELRLCYAVPARWDGMFVVWRHAVEDTLIIAGKKFTSRLMIGTGRYRSNEEMVAALAASGTQIVTVAIRRLDLSNPSEKTILDVIDWDKYTILPNTAGSKTAEEAIWAAKLGREVTGSNWVKLEVIPDAKYLLPDPIGTLRAAEELVKEGFVVLPYIHADPVLAQKLEELGCATVMPLGSAIGSGQGIHTKEEIQIILGNAKIPVVVDAGLGVPSDASQAMEWGASAVLVNTAIAQAKDPALMGEAFRLGVEAGRKAYQAGRIAHKAYGEASSPMTGVPQMAAPRRP